MPFTYTRRHHPADVESIPSEPHQRQNLLSNMITVFCVTLPFLHIHAPQSIQALQTKYFIMTDRPDPDSIRVYFNQALL
jgi:hypothetical protein